MAVCAIHVRNLIGLTDGGKSGKRSASADQWCLSDGARQGWINRPVIVSWAYPLSLITGQRWVKCDANLLIELSGRWGEGWGWGWINVPAYCLMLTVAQSVLYKYKSYLKGNPIKELSRHHWGLVYPLIWFITNYYFDITAVHKDWSWVNGVSTDNLLIIVLFTCVFLIAARGQSQL